MKKYPTIIISNFLDSEEIEFVESIFKDPDINLVVDRFGIQMSQNDNDPTESVLRSNYYYPGQTRKKIIDNFINNKINNFLKTNIKCENWHILQSFMPYTVHSDSYDKEDHEATKIGPHEDYAFTFLIPLDDYNAHTIVFNEESTDTKDPDKWIKKNNSKQKNKITEVQYSKYFTHHVDNQRFIFDYLSIESIFTWRKGDLLAMSRHSFHCSDDYPSNGLKEKRAFIGWSVVDKSS